MKSAKTIKPSEAHKTHWNELGHTDTSSMITVVLNKTFWSLCNQTHTCEMFFLSTKVKNT